MSRGDVRDKPDGLDAGYASQFDDPSVVSAYDARPPYAEALVPWLADLAGGIRGDVLEAGCGTGELTRRLAPRVRTVTAIDCAGRMIDRARRLPGGDAPNITWIAARLEQVPAPAMCSLVVAAESFHWFDWHLVCPELARLARTPPLVLVDRREGPAPWSEHLKKLIERFSTNVHFESFDLVDELVGRAWFASEERRTFGPERVRQTIDDYIRSIHSRNGFSRDRMTPAAAAEFDGAVRRAVMPWATDGIVELQIETRAVRGRALQGVPADARSAAG